MSPRPELSLSRQHALTPDDAPALQAFGEDTDPAWDPPEDLDALLDDGPAPVDLATPTARSLAAAASSQGSPSGPVADEAQLVAWITAVVGHDQAALAALYEHTSRRVHGLVLRITRCPALADEVVEDTFFQVWRQAVRFDPARGRALTWLLAMARSRAIDTLRREARNQHQPLSDEASATAAWDDPGPAADDLLAVARSHAELHRALLLLNAQPRQLVALAFLRGLSHEEIASTTALPLGTVKSQIRRALGTLKQLLGDKPLPASAR